MGRGGLGHDPTAVGMGPCAEPYAQRTVLVASERFEFFVETEAAGRGATINVVVESQSQPLIGAPLPVESSGLEIDNNLAA